MSQLRVRLAADIMDRLIAESERKHTTPSEVVRAMLDTHLPERSTYGTDARRTNQPAP